MIEFPNKASVFRDAALEEEFKREGFVCVPFLDENMIEELEAIYKRIYPDGVAGFFSTTFAPEPAHRAEVNHSIQKICRTRMDEIFENYKTFFSSFIVKAPGPESELILHQDMTLVDERTYSGINIWCPLIDLEGDNGVLHLLPRSHRIYFTYRGSSLPDIYDNVKDEIKQYLKPIPLKAGVAIIFDQSIIHYSPPNLSDQERVVINTFVAHEDAEIRICYHDKAIAQDKVEVFAQPDDFIEAYQNFGANIFDKPSIGKSLGFVDYDFPKLNAAQLDTLYGQKQPWIKRIIDSLNKQMKHD